MILFKTLKNHTQSLVALCGILISISGIVAWFVLPYIINKIIDLNVILYEETDQYERWIQLPQPLDFKVFIFNVTNPNEVQKGALPIVKEVGPYIYTLSRIKKVEDISKDKTTITYTSKQIYKFDRKRSYPRKEDDKIVVLNVAMNVILQIKNVEIVRIVRKLANLINNSAEETPIVRTVKHFIEIVTGNRKVIQHGIAIIQITEEILNSQLGFVNTNILRLFNNEKTLFMTTTPRKLFFDGIQFCISGGDKIILVICKIIKEIIERRRIKAISEMKDGSFKFAFFNYRNNTHDGQYKIYSGLSNTSLTTQILTWNGKPHLTIWNNESTSISTCNLFDKSTDGIFFPPHLKPEGNLFVYSTDICRNVELVYQKPIAYKGINGYRFVPGDNFLKKIGSKYSTKCFCSSSVDKVPKYDDGCLYKGVMDVSLCHGAPLILSLPHMLDTAPEYQTVRGLKPNAERHQMFVDIEPNTGYPLQGYKRAQFNMFIRQVDKIDLTKNLRTVLMPIVWVEEGNELNDQMIKLLNNKLFIPLLIVNIAVYMCIGSGIALFLGVSLLQTCKYFTRRKHRVKIVAPFNSH